MVDNNWGREVINLWGKVADFIPVVIISLTISACSIWVWVFLFCITVELLGHVLFFHMAFLRLFRAVENSQKAVVHRWKSDLCTVCNLYFFYDILYDIHNTCSLVILGILLRDDNMQSLIIMMIFETNIFFQSIKILLAHLSDCHLS